MMDLTEESGEIVVHTQLLHWLFMCSADIVKSLHLSSQPRQLFATITRLAGGCHCENWDSRAWEIRLQDKYEHSAPNFLFFGINMLRF